MILSLSIKMPLQVYMNARCADTQPDVRINPSTHSKSTSICLVSLLLLTCCQVVTDARYSSDPVYARQQHTHTPMQPSSKCIIKMRVGSQPPINTRIVMKIGTTTQLSNKTPASITLLQNHRPIRKLRNTEVERTTSREPNLCSTNNATCTTRHAC